MSQQLKNPAEPDDGELRAAASPVLVGLPERKGTPANPSRESWLESLLLLSVEAPLSMGLEPVTRHFVRGATRVLGRCAIGACVVRNSEEPFLDYVLPSSSHEGPGRDPTRLFPSYAEERVVVLEDGAQGSTLHVAVFGASERLHDTEDEIILRLGQSLSAALRNTREFQQHQERTDDLKRLQAQVIQAEKLASLGQIAAGVVHELNNPLTSIIAYSDYLRKKADLRKSQGDDVSDDLERLRRIGDAAQRIQRFSRDLMAYARPSGEIPGPVNLREVIDKALVFCEHEFAMSKVQAERSVPHLLPPVRGNAGQLTQVFVNLFTNAAHAMSEAGGALEITAYKQDDSLIVVDVADSGMGIAPEALDHIFEPFYTTKSDGRGTGLGLSIVRDIVKQHGGCLTARNRANKGAVFTLELPTAAVPGGAPETF